MKPLRQSTLNHGRYVPVHLCAWICSAFSRNVQLKCVLLPWRSSKLNSSKTAYSHVASWADKYLDSGVSLTMDTVESAGSDYDSDDSRSSQETVHHSYSYVPSDFEVRAHVGQSVHRDSEATLTCSFSGIRNQIWSCAVCDTQQKKFHSIISTETFVCIFHQGTLYIFYID